MKTQDEIIAKVSQGQDKEKMLFNALKVIIRLYANKPHFIFELLQNAEDCEATKVLFVEHEGALEFLHNGRPFTESNLKAICDISESDKDYTDIGKFGVGFKSVYGICESVMLFSHPTEESEIYPRLHLEIKGFIEPKSILDQDIPEGFTTKFVFPFVVGKDFSNFKDIESLRNTIAQALKGIGAETLLFMKHLQSIAYQIETDGDRTQHTFSLTKWRPEGSPYQIVSTQTGAFDDVSYLVFSKQSSQQPNRTVDIAYPFQDIGGKKKFVPTKYPNIFVYFPTDTKSELNFIIQGPFKTTPDRAKVPFDEEENIALVEDLTALYRESSIVLRDEGLLDYSFIKIMPFALSYSDFLKPMVEQTWSLLREERMLLTNSGNEYVTPGQAHIARGSNLVKIFPDPVLTELINDGKQHRWLPTYITESNSEYRGIYERLRKQTISYQRSLGVQVEAIDELKTCFNANTEFLPRQSDEWLASFYDSYLDAATAFSVKDASKNMCLAKVIKTEQGAFVSTFIKNPETGKYEHNVFLPSKRGIQRTDINVVDAVMLQKSKEFFVEILRLEEPDDFDAFSKEVSEYANKRSQWTAEQRLDALTMVGLFVEDNDHKEEAIAIANSFPIVRCLEGQEITYKKANEAYLPTDKFGNDLQGYLTGIASAPIVDIDYYRANGLDLRLFVEINVRNTVVIEGETSGKAYFPDQGSNRSKTWSAIGSFLRCLDIQYVDSVLRQIRTNPNSEISKRKSKFIFGTLKKYQNNLKGKINIGAAYSETKDETSLILKKLINEDVLWLYNKEGELLPAIGLSVAELDEALYGTPNLDDPIYSLLGMKFGDIDRILSMVSHLPSEQRAELERRLSIERVGSISIQDLSLEESAFPERQIKNWDLLKTTVSEQLSKALPVQYKDKIRSIRVTKNDAVIKAYLDDMYRTKHVCFCQSCKQQKSFSENVQIQGKGDMELEVRPLFLRLCPECASKFRALRNDKELVSQFETRIKKLTEEDITKQTPVTLEFGEMEISFTQTHIAEIREILLALDETISE